MTPINCVYFRWSRLHYLTMKNENNGPDSQYFLNFTVSSWSPHYLMALCQEWNATKEKKCFFTFYGFYYCCFGSSSISAIWIFWEGFRLITVCPLWNHHDLNTVITSPTLLEPKQVSQQENFTLQGQAKSKQRQGERKVAAIFSGILPVTKPILKSYYLISLK